MTKSLLWAVAPGRSPVSHRTGSRTSRVTATTTRQASATAVIDKSGMFDQSPVPSAT